MNTLDHFLNLLDFKTSLDAFCTMCEPYDLPHKPLGEGQAYFHLLLSGKCTILCDNGERYDMESGNFLLFADGRGHTMRAGDQGLPFADMRQENYGGIWHVCNYGEGQSADMEMLCGLYSTDNPAAALLIRHFPPVLNVSLSAHKELSALCTLIRREGQARRMGSTTVIHHLCEILLLFALRQNDPDPLSLENSSLALFADPALHKVLTHIFEDLSQNYSTEQLAEIACQSRATFARRFQKAAGMGVQSFIRTLRMIEAARLLVGTKLPVSQIAERCGYQSDTAFHDNFRAQFATTPAKYRRDNQKFAAEESVGGKGQCHSATS